MGPSNNLPEAPSTLPPIMNGNPTQAAPRPQTPQTQSSVGYGAAEHQQQVAPPEPQVQPTASLPNNNLPRGGQLAENNQTGVVRPVKDMKRLYADRVKRITAESASDPYAMCQRVEALKQQYLKDVYHWNVRLPNE